MKKIMNITLKIILSIILLMSVIGVLISAEPTIDMYKKKEAYDFIIAIANSGYVMWLMTIVFIISLIFIIKNKMALVALLLLPITLNIVGFHMFLDGGIFKAGAIMGDALLIINLYFLWQNRHQYKTLF